MDEMEEMSSDIIKTAEVKKTVLSTQYTIYIDEGIIDPCFYRQAVQTIQNATDKDVVIFNINSGGGQLDTANMLADDIAKCRAKTIANVSVACSAATIPMLACDEINFTPTGYCMFHCFSTVQAGKGSELKALNEFNQKHTIHFMREAYKYVFTPEELEKLLTDGLDYWLTAEEMKPRIEKHLSERAKALGKTKDKTK